MIATFMFKIHDKDIPQVFNSMFTINRSRHNYPTRQADDYHVPNWQLETKKRAISVQGALIWNEIPANIKSSCSLNVFKYILKKHLLANI